MALIQMSIFSRSLMRTVPVTVVLPADKTSDFTAPLPPEKKFPTLYLLHGVIGSTMDWVSGTRLERYATDHDLCVVMPSGDNSFYLDRPGASQNYGQFVGEELVELTRRMFPLSRERKDTFIGGLSMGGYGALRNGLKYHDTFGAIVSLSAAIEVDGIASRTNDTDVFMQKRSFAEECFGDLDKVVESDKNPAWLVNKLAAEKADFPEDVHCLRRRGRPAARQPEICRPADRAEHPPHLRDRPRCPRVGLLGYLHLQGDGLAAHRAVPSRHQQRPCYQDRFNKV